MGVTEDMVFSTLEDDREFKFRLWELSGNVDTDTLGLKNVLPTGARLAHGEVLTLHPRSDRRGWNRNVRESKPGDGAFDEFGDEAGRTQLYQLGHLHDQVGLAHLSSHTENPARASQAARVLDIPLVEVALHRGQWDRKRPGGKNDLEMAADVIVQRMKTHLGPLVIISGQSSRVGIEAKRAQRTAQSQQFTIQLFGVCVLGQEKMTQGSKMRVQCVQEP